MTTALNVREWNPARPTLGTGCGADRAAKQRQPAPLRLSGGLPSMTPSTPRPCSLLATTISTGLAVAQKIEHTSGTFRIAFKTLMGYAFWMSSTKTWPQPNARALRMAVSRSPSSFPSARVKQAPELDRFDEMRLTHNDVGIGRKFHADRFEFKHSSPSTWM